MTTDQEREPTDERASALTDEARLIVGRLRNLEKQGEDYIWRPAKEAADFIERAILAEPAEPAGRLRERVEALPKPFSDPPAVYLADVLSVIDAERDAAREALTEGIELAARWVEKRRDDYDCEHGFTDPETGTREYPGRGAGEEYVYELHEIIEGIRALAAMAPTGEAK